MRQPRGRRGPPQGQVHWLVWAALLVVLSVGAKVAENWGIGGRSGGRPITTTGGGEITGRARPVDGDSLFVGNREVRLKGIDAPEGRQTCRRAGRDWPCGEDARRELVRLIGAAEVTCRAVEEDQHGRALAFCKANGRDLNAEMVRSGFAVSYPSFGREEGIARAGKKGLWSGEFQKPRDWRREHGIGGRG